MKTKRTYNKRTDSKVSGTGINDYYGDTYDSDGKILPFYRCWISMIERCYCTDNKYRPTYKDVSVCNEWLSLSSFKEWHDENYVEGYELDKDLISKSKVYSPETCCFIPKFINGALITSQSKTDYYTGVNHLGINSNGKPYKKPFRARIKLWGKPKSLGTFTTPEEAHQRYRLAKKIYLEILAEHYYEDGKISKRVYDALMDFEVPDETLKD